MVSKKALIMGLNYKNSKYELNGCINDANNMYNFLTNNCLFNSKNIKVLTDETKNKPTLSNIKKYIKWLISGALPGDILVLTYSGHGSNIKDKNNDETDGSDEVLVPLDVDSKGFLSDDWLFKNLVNQIPKDVTLWCFFDCCNSGTIIDLKYNYKSSCVLKNNKKVEKYISNDWTDSFKFSMEKSKEILGNVYLFSGCQDNEYSEDAFVDNKGTGAFTYCLLECFKNNLVKVSENSFRFLNSKLKLCDILKEVNCRLDINGFTTQNTQLSLCNYEHFNKTLDL
jgi:hypothetical protein